MLNINGMTKLYKSGRGIFDIDLKVKKGEIYGLLGPNGAGKTTLLKITSGLLNISTGSCTINETSLQTNPVAYKSQMVGMIGETVLYDYLSPMEHLSMMRPYRNDISSDEMCSVLAAVDLVAYKDEPIKQFSTGMKQRLAFAMCLIAKPDVLLLDEPFSGLDIEGKLLIRSCLLQLKNEGHTAILISSHLIHDLEEIADKVGVIKDGRMIDEQTVDHLLRHHKNLETYFVQQTTTLKEGA